MSRFSHLRTADSNSVAGTITSKFIAISLLLALTIPTVLLGQSARGRSETSSLAEAAKTKLPDGVKGEENYQSPIEIEPVDQDLGTSPCGWSAGTVYPQGILDQATTTVGSNLYTFAGVSTTIIANSYKFDGTTWTAIAPLPAALEFPTAVSDGTSAYIFGGADSTGVSVNTLYKYNPGTNSYTTLASSAAATSAWNAAGAYLNGKIYKIGGFNSTSSATTSISTVEIYDIATNTWSTGASYPIAAGFMSAFVRNGFIYVAGGVDATSGAGSVKTYRYDPTANTWDDASIADLPADRWGAASSQVTYNGGWVLAGGYVAGAVSATAVKWDPVANTWSALPSMTAARARMTGSVVAGSFFAIGGRTSAGGFAGTNDNQKLFCVDPSQPFLTGAVNYVSDNGTPVNNVPDPGETVTVSLSLTNSGGASTGNVTATLAPSGGITNPSGPISFGVINAGQTVSRNFTFQVPTTAACGGSITLTFNIADGTTNYTVTKTYTLGVTAGITQNFDGVTAPALPAGWTMEQTSGTGITWVTSTTSPNSPPNAAFANASATVNAAALVSPVVNVTSSSAFVTFKNNFDLETNFDGVVLEIKIGTGAWQDIVTAGGAFTAGGYTSTISSGFMSPIAGRRAWSGNSAGYITSTATLPAAANGQAIQLRWLSASDSSVAVSGNSIDDVQIVNGYACSTVNTTVRSRADFDGDGKTDVSVFRPSEGNWYLNQSTAGFGVIKFGVSTDTLIPSDYDGDGKTDTAVFRPAADPSLPDYYILRSNGFTLTGYSWGLPGDIPVVGDFDGDGKADGAVYRPSTQYWYILNSSNGSNTIANFGAAGDIPVAIDNDGDGKNNLAVFRPSTNTWYIARATGSTSNFDAVQFGASGDKLVPADYDGDNKDDIAVFRPSTGIWYILRSSGGGVQYVSFGASGDVPVPGDYDGDGKDDQAVYRSGTWYLNRSTAGFAAVAFGTASDTPIPAKYIP